MKAEHDRRQKEILIQLLNVVHSKDPKALHDKLWATLFPADPGAAFDRLMQKARAQAAERAQG